MNGIDLFDRIGKIFGGRKPDQKLPEFLSRNMIFYEFSLNLIKLVFKVQKNGTRNRI